MPMDVLGDVAAAVKSVKYDVQKGDHLSNAQFIRKLLFFHHIVEFLDFKSNIRCICCRSDWA